jgi:hypothetical protein
MQDDGIAEITVDLSGDGVTRGPETSTAEKPISLPRRLINLRMILPYYSPAGKDQVTIAHDRNSAPVQSESAKAAARGPRTVLRVRLDLRSLSAGQYYLGTTHDGESTTYFYPFTVG